MLAYTSIRERQCKDNYRNFVTDTQKQSKMGQVDELRKFGKKHILLHLEEKLLQHLKLRMQFRSPNMK
jgi:hypothetical protein